MRRALILISERACGAPVRWSKYTTDSLLFSTIAGTQKSRKWFWSEPYPTKTKSRNFGMLGSCADLSVTAIMSMSNCSQLSQTKGGSRSTIKALERCAPTVSTITSGGTGKTAKSLCQVFWTSTRSHFFRD